MHTRIKITVEIINRFSFTRITINVCLFCFVSGKKLSLSLSHRNRLEIGRINLTDYNAFWHFARFF